MWRQTTSSATARCLAYRICELSHVQNWTPTQTLRAAKLLCILCAKSINGTEIGQALLICVYVSPHEVNNETGTMEKNLDNLLMGLLIYVFATENITKHQREIKNILFD